LAARLLAGRCGTWPEGQLAFYDAVGDFQRARATRARLFTQTLLDASDDGAAMSVFAVPHPRAREDILLTKLACTTYLLANGIAQGDRLSMASSVEMRLPLLDYRFVETVIGLRKHRPDHTFRPKRHFLRAIRDLIPDVLTRRQKRGFEPPVREWQTALTARYGPLLDGGVLTEQRVLRHDGARAMSAPGRENAFLAFKALVLEIWCRQMSGKTFDTGGEL
jgi:asparagine synthase (glutamine-hydrolysing)